MARYECDTHTDTLKRGKLRTGSCYSFQELISIFNEQLFSMLFLGTLVPSCVVFWGTEEASQRNKDT